MDRILTKLDRAAHITGHTTPENTDEYKNLLGDCAAYQTNIFHNCDTGFHEFFSDTPTWIRDIAKKRKWAS